MVIPVKLIGVPKEFVLTSGYIGAILIFLLISIVALAVFIPKLVKPVYTPPTAKLEAKADYSPYTYVGSTWDMNVTVYENSRATAHDVSVTLVSSLFGNVSKTVDIIMPYTSEVFSFSIPIPQNTKPGQYSVNLVINAKEAKPSQSTIMLKIFASAPENNTNST